MTFVARQVDWWKPVTRAFAGNDLVNSIGSLIEPNPYGG